MTFRLFSSVMVILLLALVGSAVLRAQWARQGSPLELMIQVYRSSGEDGLRRYVRSTTAYLTHEQVQTYAQTAALRRNEPLLLVLEIFAEERQDSSSLAWVHFFRGYYLFLAGKNSEAVPFYQRALQFFEKVDDFSGQGNVHTSLGDIALRTGANAKAEECYQMALPLYQKADNSIGQGHVYNSLGDLAFYTGANAKAEEYYQKALTFVQKAGSPLGQGNVYMSLGDIALRTGANAKAEEYYQKAISLHQGAGAIQNQSYALVGMARVRGAEGKTRDAIALYEKALTNLEKVRSQTGSLESRMRYLETAFTAYEEMAAYLAKYGYNEKAFRLSEIMKARAFVDQIAESISDVKRGISPALKEKRDELSQRLSFIEKKLVAAGYRDSAREALSKEHLQTEMELDRVIGEIRHSNPQYAAVRYPQPLSVLHVENQLLEPKVALPRVPCNRLGILCICGSLQEALYCASQRHTWRD